MLEDMVNSQSEPLHDVSASTTEQTSWDSEASDDATDDADVVPAETILSRQKRATNCCVQSTYLDFKRHREPKQLLKMQCVNKKGEIVQKVRVKYRIKANVYRVVRENLVVACRC